MTSRHPQGRGRLARQSMESSPCTRETVDLQGLRCIPWLFLRHATALIDSGRLSPRVDPREFSLDSVAEAYELVRGRSSLGKVVVNHQEAVGAADDADMEQHHLWA